MMPRQLRKMLVVKWRGLILLLAKHIYELIEMSEKCCVYLTRSSTCMWSGHLEEGLGGFGDVTCTLPSIDLYLVFRPNFFASLHPFITLNAKVINLRNETGEILFCQLFEFSNFSEILR